MLFEQETIPKIWNQILYNCGTAYVKFINLSHSYWFSFYFLSLCFIYECFGPRADHICCYIVYICIENANSFDYTDIDILETVL